MGSSSAFQEHLELEPVGRFRYAARAEALGLDPKMLALIAREGRFCFLDFEATGLDADADELIEVGAAAVRSDSDRVEIFNTFLHTERELSPFIRRLTGITQQDVETAPPPREVAVELNRFIGEAPVVAHNARFEQSWLVRLVGERFASHPFLDTVELLALVYPDTPNMKLDTFCRAKLARRERHRALDDAIDTLRICVNVLAEARAGDPAAAHAREAMRLFRPSSPWLPRLAEIPQPAQTHAARPTTPRIPNLGVAPVPWDLEAIIARIENADIGARVIPGYAPREGQLELLRTAYACFAGRDGASVRVREAGTGIGKTLAYLAVAIPFARASGEPVIVSTSSKLLQRQLMEKDIPAAAAILGHRDLRYTSIKGRANYLCRARLDRFLERQRTASPPVDSFPVALLAAFAGTTKHGEVDRIPGVLFSMYPELDRYVRDVTSADASECSRATCEKTTGPCPFREARERVAGADLVVVNHDLLLRWPPDYPPLRHLVIDEVHELAERADAAYARTADGVELAHRIETILAERSLFDTDVAAIEELGRRALHLITAVGTEAKQVAGAENPAAGWRDELVLPLGGPSANWHELLALAGELAETLEALGRRLAERAEAEESPVTGPTEALLDAAEALTTAFANPVPRETDVVVRFRGLARQSAISWRLIVTPVSPAADFEFQVLSQVQTMFATSATVSVDGDVRGGLGILELEDRAGARYRMEPPIESPFPYEQNLEVVFLDEPTDSNRLVPRTADAIRAAALRLGGKTMALFTSRARLTAVADALDAEFRAKGISIIAPSPGNADPHDLVRTFLESDTAVLLGSRAFWQGVDVPGDACQMLVIEKLPFDVPSDPLVQRRCELIDRDGGQSFQEYMLPRMLLRLKQMLGRLIRTPTDRGMVVVVEPRCDRAYFPRILEALPPRARHRRARLSDLGPEIDAFFGLEN